MAKINDNPVRARQTPKQEVSTINTNTYPNLSVQLTDRASGLLTFSTFWVSLVFGQGFVALSATDFFIKSPENSVRGRDEE